MTEEGNGEDPARGAKLREEAEAIRSRLVSTREERRSGLPAGRRFLYLSWIMGILGVSFFLLLAPGTRQTLITQVVTRLFDIYPVEKQSFNLPPPPPKPAATRVESPSITFTDEGFEGILYADGNFPATVDSSEEEGPQFVPPAKSDASQSAFSLLQANSEIVAQILSSQTADFEFKQWTPLKDNPPVFWIDIVVNRVSDGTELHLVWEVNVERESIQPLSQAAKDLAG